MPPGASKKRLLETAHTLTSGGVSTPDLLPFCYRTAQYEAGQRSIRQRATLENNQLIQTYWYGMVGEVIAVAELRSKRDVSVVFCRQWPKHADRYR
jgi:hypothetical protein